MSVVPAIIPRSLDHLRASLDVIGSVTKEIQVDIVDGVFSSPVSWPYGKGTSSGEENDIAKITDLYDIEIDNMVQDPEGSLEEWDKTGVKRMVVHVESTKRLQSIVERTKEYNFRLILSLGNDTPLEEVTKYSEHITAVQCMGIAKIGVQGNPFDERVLERIKTLRDLLPDIEISVDGSVNKKTLPLLKKAGADRFIVGSAIFGSDNPIAAYRELELLAD